MARVPAPTEPVVRLTEPGRSVTVSVTATADRDTIPWQVTALDLDAEHGQPRCVDAKLDRTSVHPGDSARLTITLRHKNTNDLCVVGLVSTRRGQEHLWPLAVSTR